MAYTTPTGIIYLLKDIPFDKQYNHTKYFSSASAQHNWICQTNHIIGSSNPKTAQNIIKDPIHGTIKISGHQENYIQCSYIAWSNTSIDGTLPDKYVWNYAFVDDVRYMSNAVIEIDYSIDCLQTYLIQGGCSVEKAYIKRTHTQSDNFGANLEPEPVTFSDYKLTNRQSPIWNSTYTNWSLLVYASRVFNGPSAHSQGLAGNITQGLVCNVFKGGYYTSGTTAMSDFAHFLNSLDDTHFEEVVNSIVGVIAVPSEFITTENDANLGTLANDTPYIKTIDDVIVKHKSGTIDGYTPTNKKLFTYPYNCLHVTDGDKSSSDFRYEYFEDNTNYCDFKCTLAVQPVPEAQLTALNYAGGGANSESYDKKITMTDFPQIPIVNDSYKQWLGTSKIGTGVSMVAGGIGLVGSLMSGNGLGAIGSGLSLAHSIGSYADASANAQQTPPTVKSGSSSAMVAGNDKNFYFYQKCINKEDAERIDHFFSRYGYAVNRIATIHFTNERFNQHYVQTSECIVSGGAPSTVKDTIANAFNKGITFWKNDVGNYTT